MTSLAVEFQHLIPPEKTGLGAFSMVTARLRERAVVLGSTEDEVRDVLWQSYQGAEEGFRFYLRLKCRGIGDDLIEETIRDAMMEIPAWYASMRSPARFSAFVKRALKHRIWKLPMPAELPEDIPDGSTAVTPEPSYLEDPEREAVVVRQALWYLYGSYDHPEYSSGWKILAKKKRSGLLEFVVLAHRLGGRPFSELARLNQPRAGLWGRARGESDNKWWRNHYQRAITKFRGWLHSAEGVRICSLIRGSLQEDR